MPKRSHRPATLWSQAGTPDALMMAYTVGDDRTWDTRLLRWDVLGSLGHIEGLRASGLLSSRDHASLRRGLRQTLAAVQSGRLVIGPEHEDAHSAVEDWLTRRLGSAGARVHTGRSRNDQITVDLRLYLKDALLQLQGQVLALSDGLLAFAARYPRVLWPGYTHQRRAMPSSAALWAAGLAEGLLTSAEALPSLWARVDRSPLGSAAGYGVPLPLNREATMRALGFSALDQVVTVVQNSRGKLEAAALAWCADLGHDLSRLASDVILLSAEEFGFLVLPPDLATGSSIMPHKRNPDLFELTRARAAAVEGDLAAMLFLKGKLTGGYHRDFQLLKEPLFRGLDRTGEMLAMMAHALPRLGVDETKGRAALRGEALATDEVMRRVEGGVPFRQAYRAVAEELKQGVIFPTPTVADLVRRRRSTGNLGNIGLAALRGRVRAGRQWHRKERTRFDRAMGRLGGRRR
jgi:argininosuccinate lyase